MALPILNSIQKFWVGLLHVSKLVVGYNDGANSLGVLNYLSGRKINQVGHLFLQHNAILTTNSQVVVEDNSLPADDTVLNPFQNARTLEPIQESLVLRCHVS